jgi:hypothetical protein
MLNLIPECHTAQRSKTWLLYPMLEGGALFQDRVHVGSERVLVVADGTGHGPYSNLVYCGAVFHPKERDGYFEPCDEA